MDRRSDYVRSMASVLRPGGRLVGLLWNHGRPGGPPYDVRREDVEALFPPLFTIESIEAVPDSIAGRTPEMLATLRRS
jgi:methyl halide transferase